ncbi:MULTISPECIES: hypothetical protein [unclassified Luteimonas]|uniref:hypothetical protein n=1 Tax=unclassified Luteimonas TaxID=2629088 RepID=UPI00160060A4|nr:MULTISPECIES: hypothetical protein [unclassified Luteimonas]MBB1473292.1 hypothetical protein [Luteimonas sp. MC1782]MBB6600534.1 hypothetical protein [Luteimonas sp. MC1825]QOC88190.1 hypothetical protein IDM46_13470 [Luteimonas sp. MC1825]
MDVRTSLATLLLAAAIAPVAAQESIPSLPAVKAEALRYLADCDHRVLPTQREVGEWTGQHNFSQVYDTRLQLMAEIGRTCEQPGIEQVQVVTRDDPAPRQLELVAINGQRPD